MNADSENDMGSIPDTVMNDLVKELSFSGRPWRDVLEDPRYPVLNRKFRWFTNPQKGMFYRLVTPGQRRAFLDIGAASGIVSACLSEDYEKGFALERQQVFVEFMKLRFQLDSIANVQVLHGSALEIPLPDNCIDLAAVNGVLEWIPHADKQTNPRKVQLKFLREVGRCLNPGGKIVIAIENAWDYKQLSGFSAHSTARYVGFLPKWLGNIVNLIFKRQPYREYIYSYFGYQRLLKEAGYRNVRIFVVMPDYYSPVDIYSFDRNALNEFYLKYHSGSRMKRMLKRLSDTFGVVFLWAYFEAAFYIEAEM